MMVAVFQLDNIRMKVTKFNGKVGEMMKKNITSIINL